MNLEPATYNWNQITIDEESLCFDEELIIVMTMRIIIIIIIVVVRMTMMNKMTMDTL